MAAQGARGCCAGAGRLHDGRRSCTRLERRRRCCAAAAHPTAGRSPPAAAPCAPAPPPAPRRPGRSRARGPARAPPARSAACTIGGRSSGLPGPGSACGPRFSCTQPAAAARPPAALSTPLRLLTGSPVGEGKAAVGCTTLTMVVLQVGEELASCAAAHSTASSAGRARGSGIAAAMTTAGVDPHPVRAAAHRRSAKYRPRWPAIGAPCGQIGSQPGAKPVPPRKLAQRPMAASRRGLALGGTWDLLLLPAPHGLYLQGRGHREALCSHHASKRIKFIARRRLPRRPACTRRRLVAASAPALPAAPALAATATIPGQRLSQAPQNLPLVSLSRMTLRSTDWPEDCSWLTTAITWCRSKPMSAMSEMIWSSGTVRVCVRACGPAQGRRRGAGGGRGEGEGGGGGGVDTTGRAAPPGAQQRGADGGVARAPGPDMPGPPGMGGGGPMGPPGGLKAGGACGYIGAGGAG